MIVPQVNEASLGHKQDQKGRLSVSKQTSVL